MNPFRALLLALAFLSPLAAAEPLPPVAAKPGTVVFPRDRPTLFFRPPPGWVVAVPPDGSPKMSVAKPRGPGVIFSASEKSQSDAEMAQEAATTAQASAELSPKRNFKPSPAKPTVLGTLRGVVVEMPGHVDGTPIMQRIYVLRSPKRKTVTIILTGPPDPLPSKIRAFLDSIAPLT